jgi:hypothetical protein
VGFSLISPITTPIGAALRGMVATFSSKPFIYLENAGKGKELPADQKISLLSYNICCTPGGYSITDGQVTPPSDKERMNANIEKIKEINPDMICLYEMADINDAHFLFSRLPDYPFLIPVAGMRAMSPSSMLFVASKYAIDKDSIEFVPFVKNSEITGRARFSEKGFLSFDIMDGKKAFATIISTHLQHSEIPAQPTDSDRTSRSRQMDKIAMQIQKKAAQGLNVIFTGDLNQAEEELEHNQMNWLRRDPSVKGKITWGGDQWCAHLMGKTPSEPLVLDYTMIAGATAAISTKIIDTGYASPEFKHAALSDHLFLFSTMTVTKPLEIFCS